MFALDSTMNLLLPFINLLLNLTTWQILWWIYVAVFVILFLLSSFGRKLGLRRKYTQALLKIFEFSNSKTQKRKSSLISSKVFDTEFDSSWSESFENPNLSFDHPHSLGSNINGYQLDDILPYITAGMATVVEDSVTPQFVSEELPYWNLLSRTNTRSYEFISLRLTFFWGLGFIIRYFLLLPLRVIILFAGMAAFSICSLMAGPIPNGSLKRRLNAKISITCLDFIAGCLSLVATFHDSQNKPQSGIAVANHTSPIDSVVLATDNCYDMVGQKHGGFLGFFMRILSQNSNHLWFERFETKDRALVARRLREHAMNPDYPPILIFPEGVCVNNTSVMQFRKGAFEAADEIHPVVIKFDARFGDAYWWQDHFYFYILSMMTSWAIVCDVWYLPPMKRMEEEAAVDFAKRVKAAIAAKGGLTDVSWDGFLKGCPVKDEWLKQQQLAFAKYVLAEPKVPEECVEEERILSTVLPEPKAPEETVEEEQILSTILAESKVPEESVELEQILSTILTAAEVLDDSTEKDPICNTEDSLILPNIENTNDAQIDKKEITEDEGGSIIRKRNMLYQNDT